MYRRNMAGEPGGFGGHTRVSYVRNPNFLQRIGNSLVGILVGLALLIVACCLIFWNEGRAVQTAKSLEEGLSIVVPLQSSHVISIENNGKLVHLSGSLKTDKILRDDMYNIEAHAVKLRRKVEMYQWVEHVEERKYDEGNGQTRVEKSYSYSMEWRSDLVRSQSFDDHSRQNPTSMAVPSQTFEADRVYVGEFELSKVLVGRISQFQQLSPQNRPLDHRIQLFDGMFYHSYDPAHPQIGDTRVSFEYAGISGPSPLGAPTVVSVVARQLGHQLLSYRTLAGDELEMLQYGVMSAKEMFGKEQMQNTILTWAIRFGGWLLMFIGFSCLTSIITTIVDWLPIVRDLVALGVNMMNLAFSISLSLTVIALGWIWYRPLLGAAILVMAAAPLFMSKFRAQQTSSNRYV